MSPGIYSLKNKNKKSLNPQVLSTRDQGWFFLYSICNCSNNEINLNKNCISVYRNYVSVYMEIKEKIEPDHQNTYVRLKS